MPTAVSASPAEPTRLALVITELAPGGAERCLVELATRLDSSRFSPIVYSLAPPPPANRTALVERLAAASVPTNFLGLKSWTQYWSGVKRLAELLRQERSEIVQTFLFHANVLGARAARAADVAHVMTGLRVADPRPWRAAIERMATASANRHVCVSQSVREFYRQRGFAAEKLVVIPNGIEVEKWSAAAPADPASFGVPAGRRIILFVGRLDLQKGLDAFFRALPAVFSTLPQHDLLLVGDGPLADRLRRLAVRMGMADRVHFAGWREDIPAIVSAADVLALPSRWEGMPNVVLEAMAAAKPVVATQAEGTVELLGLAALDQTAAVGSMQDFRAKLVRIGQDAALARELGQQNQARARQFSIEHAIGRYQRLYESVLGPRTADLPAARSV